MPSVLRALQFTSDQVSARGELTQVGSTIRFQEVTNDTGVGALFVGRGEPALTAASSRPEIGRIIRIDVDTTPAFPWFIEQIRYVHLHEKGKAQEGWALRGRGTLSVFERAVVWPPLGVGRALFSDLRVWNFASPELDDTTWDTAVATELAHVGFNFGLVELFPDTSAEWIWDRAVGGGIGTGDNAPQGTCYYSTTFTAASAMNHELWFAADDSYEVWIDGVQVLTDPGYYKGNVRRTKPFALDAGAHSIRVRATNQNAAKAGILGTVIEVDAGGLYGDVICKTDESWKVLSYPDDPPGFTVGQILRILLDEAQDRNNLLDGVFVDFSDDEDTDGDDWPMLTEFSARIGSSYYSVIRQLCETEIDVKMHAADLTLSAWNKGAAGAVAVVAVVFDGQSLNNAPATPSPDSPPFVDRVMDLVGDIPWSNVSVGGQSWTELAVDAATRLHPSLAGAASRVLVLNGGQSDILVGFGGEGNTAAQALTDMEDYADAARTAGADYIIALTLPPGTWYGAPDDAERLALNAAMFGSSSFDEVVDIASLPELADPSDLTYFYDGLHWTGAGADAAAALVAPAVAAAVASAASPGVVFDNATGNPATDNIRTLTHEVSNVGAVVP